MATQILHRHHLPDLDVLIRRAIATVVRAMLAVLHVAFYVMLVMMPND